MNETSDLHPLYFFIVLCTNANLFIVRLLERVMLHPCKSLRSSICLESGTYQYERASTGRNEELEYIDSLSEMLQINIIQERHF